jgi:hypothetical protein
MTPSMSRIKQWIARLDAGETIDWRKEEFLLVLDMVGGAERFATKLIEQDTVADDHYEQDAPAR